MKPSEFWGTDKQAIIVDIDGTLCEDNSFPHYAKAIPKEGQIKFLQQIKEHYFIVLWSARYEADREITQTWLHSNNVPYDRLILGKMPYDFFIDENAYKKVDEFAFLECPKLL